MKISPSRVLKGQTCMKQVYFHYKLGIKPEITSANLAFGKAVDQMVMDYLEAQHQGQSIDTEEAFMRHWKKKSAISLEYSATQSAEKFEKMGVAMAKKFPAAWQETGLTVFTLPNAKPALQVELQVKISPKDILGGFLDLIAIDQEGRLVIIDIKTTGVAYDEIFTYQSDQLTAYQILVDAHVKQWGMEQTDRVGFMCLHKKAKPEIHAPQIVERRNKQRVQEYLSTCMNYIRDYNEGRFNRTSLGAFNSPCNLCDFNLLCSQGITDDLIIPDLAKQIVHAA